MKDFLKFTLATVTGIVISSVVLFFISILVVFSMVSSSESETQVRKNSVMMLDLNGTLAERSQENPLDLIMKDDYRTYGLDDILSSIKKAKENEDIKGIYIQATSLGAGFASLEEIRNALKDFKESGKFVVAYGDAYTQGLYYLSSVADKVLLNPQGMLEWRGLAATPMFFKDLLEKVGVEMQVFKVGTYKSAVEPFISTEMSAANREQINVYLSSIWGQITSAVAESRNLSVEALNKEADRMLMFYPAEESVKNGLVDTLIYKNDVRDYLKNLAGIDKDDNMPVLVVLRVNSPGGSAYGSEQIWYAVNQLKKEKPVIVSMGDYAASGGYYISCNADTIVAEPTTLTGSIGIFGMMPNAKGLTEKLGVNFDLTRPMNDGEKGLMQMYVNNGYELFLTRCSDGRGISMEELDKIAQGRVWTGSTAKELGLVDELGGLDKALEIAIAKAGVDAYTVMSYPKKEGFLESLMNTNPGNYIKGRMLNGKMSDMYRQFSIIENFDKIDRIQARVPFELNIQ